MKKLLQNLVKLQSLEFDELKVANAGASIAELRGKIPLQILDHYDRLTARGKKGIAAVENHVCTGCHMRLPISVTMTLLHGQDIQLCDNCGRYLYLADTKAEAPTILAQPTTQKAQKSKATLNAV